MSARPVKQSLELPLRPPGPASLDPSAESADITIEVVTDDRSPYADREFQVRVTSPLLPESYEWKPEVWHRPRGLHDLVLGYMDDLVRARPSSGEIMSKLRGIGQELYRIAPRRFHELLWRLLDDELEPTSMLIVSEDWVFPWEIMLPHRPIKGRATEWRDLIGLDFAVGRWITDAGDSPDQQIPMFDSYVFAPRYQKPQRLKHRNAESDLVCAAFRGQPITPSDYAGLDDAMWSPVSMLHFICHGTAATPPNQAILLPDDGVLVSRQLPHMDGVRHGVGAARPFVFMNACELGRQAPALVGTGGFGVEFITLGARCVIAPMWSVRDEIAADVARRFYEGITSDPHRTFGDLLCAIRRLAITSGEDSYAAYCLYGDPCARALVITDES